MAEQLPPLNARLLERYVEARTQRLLDRLIPKHWEGSLTAQELYGMIGALAEMRALIADAERSQRKESDEVRTVTGPEYGRRS